MKKAFVPTLFVSIAAFCVLSGCATSGSRLYPDVPLDQSVTLIVQSSIYIRKFDGKYLGDWGAGGVFFQYTMIVPDGTHVLEWDRVNIPQQPVTAVFEAGRVYYFDDTGRITDRGPQKTKTARKKPEAPSARTAALVAETVQSIPEPAVLFEGDGGKGRRLAVLVPTAIRLTKDDDYLPTFIQGSLTGGFNRFSAITVIDRQNMDRIIAEQKLSESGNFSEADYIRIGNMTNTQLILAGTVTKTNAGYILDLGISDAETGVRKYSYPPKACTAADIESGEAAAAAVEDLLTQMGIRLTALGRTELHRTAKKETVNAEVAMSKGIVAQKSGTVVEALSYLYQANRSDPGLREAASRLTALSARVSSGNLREDFKNDIQRRDAWIKTLTEAEEYFSKMYPFRLVYDPSSAQQRNPNYQKKTMDIVFTVELQPTELTLTYLKVLQNVCEGLRAVGRSTLSAWSSGEDFDLNSWPKKQITRSAFLNTWNSRRPLFFRGELINEKGKKFRSRDGMVAYSVDIAPQDTGGSYIALNRDGAKGRTVLTFESIPVDDITDTLTVNIDFIGIQNVGWQTTFALEVYEQDVLTERFTTNMTPEEAGRSGFIEIITARLPQQYGYTTPDRWRIADLERLLKNRNAGL
ncbi:hypothetical protein AGMMS49944_26190 [Spirochaetia bacterium]|nr:hypothetical protein AGMMS49944_26190 [Spirochaetia bacterium]